MMSQNRQNAKDREKAEADYAVDRQAELDIAAVHVRLDELTDGNGQPCSKYSSSNWRSSTGSRR
jgi:uncharacterized membrane protein